MMVFAAVTAGMAVISQAAPMAKDMHHLSPKSAGMLVAMMALANGFGRFFWPTLSDRVGRRKVVLFLYITLALMFLVLVHLPNPVLFGAAFCYVTMCYGGMFGTMPAFTADLFGHEAVGKMYGPVMSAVSVAGLVGPMLFSILRQHTAGYALPAQITAGLCIAACVLPFLVGRKK